MGEAYNKLTQDQKNIVMSLMEKSMDTVKIDPRQSDLTDIQIGDWTVLQYAGHKKWVCLCRCGNIRKINGYELRNGNSKSCGHRNKAESIIGKRFGYLEVLEKVNSRQHKCVCHCGCNNTVKIVGTYDLKSGKVKSCGMNTTRKKSIIGQKFNHWTVIDYLGEGIYKCQCDCDNQTIGKVKRADLVSGRSKSCGHSTNRLIDIKGKQFGEWTALEHVGYGQWLCECSCENRTRRVLNHTDLISGNTKSCGCKHAETLKETMFKRYGDIASCKIDNPRTAEQLSMIESEQSLRKAISNNFDHKPFIYEIEDLLGISYAHIIKIIHKFNMEDAVLINAGYSKYEEEIHQFILSLGVKNIVRNERGVLHGKELDIYLPDHALAVEFNGDYWHSEVYKDKNYHQIKSIQGFNNKIQIVHIFEHEWIDRNKQNIIKNLLKTKILGNSRRVQARNCTISTLEVSEATAFIERYHLQGWAQAPIRYGIFFNNELLGIMTFGKPRFKGLYDYELIRLAWKEDTYVIGGAEKLFKKFISEYNPKTIVSYCDIGKFNGVVYSRLGFKLNSLKATDPNYVWVDLKTLKCLPRYQTQKHKLLEKGLGKENETESEIMTNLGYVRVYDSGNAKFVWTNS